MFKIFVFIVTEKKFFSQICNRSFSTETNLNQHMNIHDKSKTFKCDVCLKLFVSKSDLIRHYRIHTKKTF